MFLPKNKPQIEVKHADQNHDLLPQLLLSGVVWGRCLRFVVFIFEKVSFQICLGRIFVVEEEYLQVCLGTALAILRF